MQLQQKQAAVASALACLCISRGLQELGHLMKLQAAMQPLALSMHHQGLVVAVVVAGDQAGA